MLTRPDWTWRAPPAPLVPTSKRPSTVHCAALISALPPVIATATPSGVAAVLLSAAPVLADSVPPCAKTCGAGWLSSMTRVPRVPSEPDCNSAVLSDSMCKAMPPDCAAIVPPCRSSAPPSTRMPPCAVSDESGPWSVASPPSASVSA